MRRYTAGTLALLALIAMLLPLACLCSYRLYQGLAEGYEDFIERGIVSSAVTWSLLAFLVWLAKPWQLPRR